MMLILRMFLSFGWRSWCNFLRTLNGIVVLYLHNSLAGVCGGIFTIGENQPRANSWLGQLRENPVVNAMLLFFI